MRRNPEKELLPLKSESLQKGKTLKRHISLNLSGCIKTETSGVKCIENPHHCDFVQRELHAGHYVPHEVLFISARTFYGKIL